tara:strand:- start:292023 stop:292928 length:906 start_codon:yes stop_codon:yes gene_type:complete
MKPVIIAIGFISGSLATHGFAQELTPRAYWPAPQGTSIASVAFKHVSGDTVPDPSLPINGVDSSINTLVAGYRHTTSLWGRTTNLSVELPYSMGDTRADRIDGETLGADYDGVGDIAFSASLNLLGAPAMSPQEFADLRHNPVPQLGVSLKIVAPSGDYNPDKLINVGTNRWAAKTGVGYIAPINQHWLLEFELASWFFADNDDYLGFKRQQDPITSGQVHLVRRFSAGFWASLNGNYYRGGRSQIGERRLDDLQRDSKLGLTVVYPLSRRGAVKLGYTNGSINDSGESFDTFLLSYSWVL